ncbi:hypothetical protein OKW33_006359 [Paraburkholderia atlantica]|nr:hypothetical protein [Paraburkholderia atlantica]
MRASVSTPDSLVTSAAQAFSMSAGVATSVMPPPTGSSYDSTVEFQLEPPVRRGVVVVPSIDRQERLSALAATGGLQDADHALLVTSYLSPALVNACRSLGVNAIDESGNAFVKDGKTLILISGRPRANELRRPSLWSKRSLQVILALLAKPALLRQGRRTIAMFAGVSTGTAQATVQTLLQRKDVVERRDGLAFTNFGRLLDEWVTLYPSLLRQSLKLGRYRATELNWWADMAPSDEWMWGGESAAALMTNYLKPALLTVYCTNGIPPQIISRGRLRPDPAGNVEFLKTPLQLDRTPGLIDNVVYPVLVYADLVASGDSRNLETAQMIREQYIQHGN